MYDTKVLKKTGEKLVAYQSTWLVEDTIAVSCVPVRCSRPRRESS